MKTENWFQTVLHKAVPPGRGAVTKLSKLLDEPRETVDRWYEGGSFPDAKRLESVLKKLGGDISRALPGYEANPVKERTVVYDDTNAYEASDEDPRSIFISGQVAAGKVSFAGEDQYHARIDTLWAKSRYWGLTAGEVGFVEVHGDSMAPEYTSGEIIACRAPINPQDIPNGTPCIFQENGDITFKLLRKASNGLVVGQPINPNHDFVVFKQGEVEVGSIVLGKVQLEKRDFAHVIDEKARKESGTKKPSGPKRGK